MKKFLSSIVLLAICSTLSFGQNLGLKPSKTNPTQVGKYQNLHQYFDNNILTNSKPVVLNEGFEGATFPPTGWVKQNGTTNALYQWKVGTGAHTGTKSAFIEYDPALAPQNEWLISPSYNLTTVSNPCLKFWWNMSYYWGVSPYNNYDFRVKVSTDGGTTWNIIFTEDSAGAFTSFTYYQKLILLTNYATSTNFKVAFQYQGSDGASLNLDDIFIGSMVNSNLTADRVTFHDGYTQIPKGLGRPMYCDADISNFGAITQTHVKLHGVDLTTGADSTSSDTTLLSNTSLADWFILNDYFYTPSTTLGTYKVTSYISSDSIPHLALDTFSIKIVCDTCKYSRDNNTYDGSRWAGATGTLSDPYTATNRFQVNQDRMAYGINCVVNNETKVGSKIKAVLYKYFAATGTRTIVAQSSNYYITAANVPTTGGVNPPSISLAFSTGYTMQKDTLYFAGIQVFGGTDTVKIAADNTGMPQWEQTSLYFDPTANTWYIWQSGNVAAMMIRTVFNQNEHWDGFVGINELNKDITLFSCMPNPANTTTQINYEMKNNEKAEVIITDITGRTVQTMNQGIKAKGNYTLDIDLSNVTSGTYFLTLKTSTAQTTEKLIVVKR